MPPTSRDLGDFQTPPALVDRVIGLLDSLQIPRTRVLEPTCGQGNFLTGLAKNASSPREMIGFDLQADHLASARAQLDPAVASLYEADFFQVDLKSLAWREFGPLLVVGNPPWVTAAELGRLGSTRGPSRHAVLGITGLDSLTGSSNFDLAEAVWQKLLEQLDESNATIALLCKYVTARKIIRWIVATEKPVSAASIYRIDAKKWFNAAVDACLLIVSQGPALHTLRIPVYPSLSATIPARELGVVEGMVVADMASFAEAAFAFGLSPRMWRQGVKHDAAAVMELHEHCRTLWNGLGEAVDVEPEHVFPLVKGADLARTRLVSSPRFVIVTQRRVGEDTRPLQWKAPKLWSYLNDHKAIFDARKSRIHRGQPPFSMFGVGDYTFASHKVAIPGVHKGVPFAPLSPVEGRPVVLDDTCYFLTCANAEEAQATSEHLNGPIARKLIAALRFDDAKRPITKAILQRIDLTRLAPLSLAAPTPLE